MKKGVCGRLKMDVPGLGNGNILDVDGKVGLASLEHWAVFVAISCWKDFAFTCTDNSCYKFPF